MKKYRICYLILTGITLLALFCSGNRYLLALSVMELLLPVILHGMMQLEMRQIRPKMQIARGCVAGESCPMYFELEGKIPFIATGTIRVVIEFHNTLYDRVIIQELNISSTQYKRKYEVDFQPISCGEEHIICKEIVCYDIFGVNSVHLQPMTEQIVTVVPRHIPLQLLDSRVLSGRQEGEQFDYRKKGNDRSEVFDIREYQPGDDVRSIHWKLSGKMDQILVKEPGYSSHYDTIVLFDIGLKQEKEDCGEGAIAGVFDFAMTFSEKLLELKKQHYVAMFMKESFVCKELDHMHTLEQLVQTSMGVSLPKQTGGVLSYFRMHHLSDQFSKIYYICGGAFSDALYSLAEETELTAFCISDAETISTIRKGKSILTEIPQKELDKAHHIEI